MGYALVNEVMEWVSPGVTRTGSHHHDGNEQQQRLGWKFSQWNSLRPRRLRVLSTPRWWLLLFLEQGLSSAPITCGAFAFCQGLMIYFFVSFLNLEAWCGQRETELLVGIWGRNVGMGYKVFDVNWILAPMCIYVVTQPGWSLIVAFPCHT